MDLIYEGQYNLTGLSKINILLGKNGCGKSTLLKKIDQFFPNDTKGEINYVTPERGGSLKYNSVLSKMTQTMPVGLRDKKIKINGIPLKTTLLHSTGDSKFFLLGKLRSTTN